MAIHYTISKRIINSLIQLDINRQKSALESLWSFSEFGGQWLIGEPTVGQSLVVIVFRIVY